MYGDDRALGSAVGAAPTPSLRLLRRGDATWRLDTGVLVGLLVSTEHLTVATLRVLPGQASAEESHAGDELLYVTSGELRVAAGEVEATLRAGDGFYVPAGVPHRYEGAGEVGEAIVGVAPDYR